MKYRVLKCGEAALQRKLAGLMIKGCLVLIAGYATLMAPPSASGQGQQSLILDVDGSQLNNRFTSVGVTFDLPPFVEDIQSTKLHPFEVRQQLIPEFWTGNLLIAAETASGTTGDLTVTISGLINGTRGEATKTIEVVVGSGDVDGSVLVDEDAPNFSLPLAGSQIDFGMGVDETAFSFGPSAVAHLTSQDGTVGTPASGVNMSFFTDGSLEGVSVSAAISGVIAAPVSTISYDVQQNQGLDVFNWTVDLNINEGTGLLDIDITSGAISVSGTIDTVTGQFVQPFPPDMEDQFLGSPSAPLFGMDTSFLENYVTQVTTLIPATPDGIQSAALLAVASGDHPKASCLAACFACGFTLFMGPTCTQWVDCIDWAGSTSTVSVGGIEVPFDDSGLAGGQSAPSSGSSGLPYAALAGAVAAAVALATAGAWYARRRWLR